MSNVTKWEASSEDKQESDPECSVKHLDEKASLETLFFNLVIQALSLAIKIAKKIPKFSQS